MLLLSVLPRGIDLACSAFGVLAAPAAASAVLARMSSVALHGCGHDALRRHCMFLHRVGPDARLCGPRAVSPSDSPDASDYVQLPNEGFLHDLQGGRVDFAETAFRQLHAQGTRAVPIVVSRMMSDGAIAFAVQKPAGAEESRLHAQRICESVRQRGGICVAVADALMLRFDSHPAGLNFRLVDVRLPDVVLSAQ